MALSKAARSQLAAARSREAKSRKSGEMREGLALFGGAAAGGALFGSAKLGGIVSPNYVAGLVGLVLKMGAKRKGFAALVGDGLVGMGVGQAAIDARDTFGGDFFALGGGDEA